MKKNIFLLMFSLIGILLGGAEQTLTIYGIKGPSGIGMIQLFESPPSVPGWTIRAQALAQADLVAAGFASGEVVMGILPPNVAAKLYNAGRPLQVVAIVGEGMLSLITSDPSIRSITDLQGKTVEVAGQGATPDFVFRRILRRYGLEAGKDVQLGYALAYPEIAQSLKAGRVQTALLPEPFATMALSGSPQLRVVGNIQDEWKKVVQASSNYPMTLLVVDRTFARSHPQVVKTVSEAYQRSIQWVLHQPAAAGALVEKHQLGLTASVATAAIPKSAYGFIPALEGRKSIEALLAAFLEFAPSSVGGKLPGDDFYGSF